MIRSFIKDTIRYLPSQLLPAIVGIFALPIITSIVNPEEFGKYSLAVAAVSIGISITSWIGTSVIRFYPKCETEDQLHELKITASIWILAKFTTFVIIATLILFQAIQFENSDTRFKYFLIASSFLLLALSVLYENVLSFLRSMRKIGVYSWFISWRSVGGLAFGLSLAAYWLGGALELLMGSVVALAIAAPFAWKMSLQQWKLPRQYFSIRLSREMWRYSLPLVFTNLSALVLSTSDRYIVELFRGSFEVGLYSVNYRISESSMMLIVSLFSTAFNPLIVQSWEKKGKLATAIFLQKSTRYFLLITIPAAVGLSVLQKPIIKILAAPEYHDAVSIMPWIAAAAFFLGLSQRYSVGLALVMKTRISMILSFSAGALNIALNVLFIPQYGYFAAAVSTTVSYLFLFVVMKKVSLQSFSWNFPLSSLRNAIISSAIMGGTIFFCNGLFKSAVMSLALSLPVGILLYTLVLLLLKELTQDEKLTVGVAWKNIVSKLFHSA